jgi:MFS family permease
VVGVYAETLGLQDAASAFFIFYAGALIASRPLASRIFDRKNANYIFLPGLALFVAAYVALARIDSAVSLFVAAILLGVGFGAVQNSTLALTVVRAPRHRLGMASATYYIMVDICSSISPIIAGLLIPVIGYRYLYLLAAVLAAIAYPVYWRFIGRDLSRSSRRS